MNNNHPYRLVLFCHERSGSTTLMDVLNLHPQLSILEEPFLHSFTEWNPQERNYLDLIKDCRSLDEQLDYIYSRYDGIKVLAYQMDEEIYEYMLGKEGYKIIFLHRRNHLQTVVSNLVAKQTNLWERSRLEGSIEALYAGLEPLSLERIEDYLQGLKELLKHYEEVIDARQKGTFMKWTYENLYLVSEKQRLANLASIYDFLEVPHFFANGILSKLNPINSKINGPATYKFIPNAIEINDRFGSEVNGWLFENA